MNVLVLKFVAPNSCYRHSKFSVTDTVKHTYYSGHTWPGEGGWVQWVWFSFSQPASLHSWSTFEGALCPVEEA